MAFSDSDESDIQWSSNEEELSRPLKRPRRCTGTGDSKLTPALYKAMVKTLADTAATKSGSGTSDIDDAIIQRIQKCLRRAYHENASEMEAKAALHLASRMMSQYNVTQAEVIAHQPAEEQDQYAGQSIVSIVRTDGSDKDVKHQAWTNWLAGAMRTYFDCKSYSTACYQSVEWTFYGIAQNTVMAALAFEGAHNCITEWARSYKGVGSKNSYCTGAASELCSMAGSEKKEEEKRAKTAEENSIAIRLREEEEQRQRELSRLQPITEDAHEMGNSGEAREDGGTAPSDEENSSGLSRQPEVTTIKDEDDEKPAVSHPGLADAGYDSDLDAMPVLDENGDVVLDPHRLRGLEESDDDAKPFIFGASHATDDEANLYADFNMGDGANPIDLTTNIDDEIQKLVKTELPNDSDGPVDKTLPVATPLPDQDSDAKQTSNPPAGLGFPGAGSSSEVEVQSTWQSSMQLTVFRQTAQRIADDYLKTQGKKIYAGRKSFSVIRDRAAYDNGKRDGRKIDVHRKRIES